MRFSKHICSSQCRSCQRFEVGQSSFVIHEGLHVFELQVESVCEIRKNMNKLLTIGRIGAQCCPVCRIGLWDETFPIFLQKLFIARCFYIPLLHFSELLLQMCIECLL